VIESGLASAALQRGGHVRIGLEDYAGPGAPSNAELVRRIAELIVASGRLVATATEAHQILGIEPSR
jgi:3-keto-5-aminohexanoate cleavage enzyme